MFLVRRHYAIAFMGGAHVFPGGRVDKSDWADASRVTDVPERIGQRMSDVSAHDALAHHVAAVRELFEEAGVLLTPDRLDAATVARLARHRRDLLAGTTSFSAILEAEGLQPGVDRLSYFSHWVTPVMELKRFDARFFVARAPEGQTPIHDDGETTDSAWFDPEEAIARCRAGEIALPPPTWTTLDALARFRTIDDALAWAANTPVPCIQPVFIEDDGQRTVCFPGDPLYPAVDGFNATHTRFVFHDDRWRPTTPD